MISFSRPPVFTPSAAVGDHADVQALRMRQLGRRGRCPSSSYMLPMRSHGYTGRSLTSSPLASEAPTTWPPLNPPPATTAEKTLPVMAAAAVPGRFPLHLAACGRTRRSTRRWCCRAGRGRTGPAAAWPALVQLRQLPAHGLEVLLVRVPALVVDGDVGHAALDQPPRHQAGLPERVAAVALAQLVLLLREVEHLAGVAEDQVVGLLLGLSRAPSSCGVAWHGVLERVQLVQQLAPVPLPLVGDALGDDAFDGEAASAPGSPPVANGL